MSPLEAAEIEIRAELAALARRLGSGQMPRSITLTIDFDDASGMPRAVELEETRRRRILGGAVATRAKRCESAA